MWYFSVAGFLFCLLLSIETVEIEASDICITSLNTILISSFNLDIQSNPIYTTINSSIYTRIDLNTAETGLQKRDIYSCTNNGHYSLFVCSDSFSNVWSLYESNETDINDSLIAFCSMDPSPDDPSACTQWMITNDSIVANSSSYPIFFTDNSFDIDDNVCVDNDTFNHTQNLCFKSIDIDDTHTHSQYLYGEWKLVANSTYNSKRYYENIRLSDTNYSSYIVWYDPKDTWYIITDAALADNTIINKYEGICNATNVMSPVLCPIWIIDNKVVALFIDNVTGCETNVDKDISTDEDELCVSFDELTDGKSNDFILQIPSFFIVSETDANDFYKLQSNYISGDRSVWKFSSSNVNFYVYYNDPLRYWIWTPIDPINVDTIVDTYGNTSVTVEWKFVFDDMYDSWCLMYDQNIPKNCKLFYYIEDEKIINVTSIVDDCTVDTSKIKDWGGHVTAYLALSCLGCLMIAFVVGYIRERRQKRERMNERMNEQMRESIRLKKRLSLLPHDLGMQLSLVDEDTESKPKKHNKLSLVNESAGEEKKEYEKPLISETIPEKKPNMRNIDSNGTDIELVFVNDGISNTSGAESDVP